MLAAARDEDYKNPERASDKYQFYIVTGKTISDDDLNGYEAARQEKYAEKIYERKVEENKEKINELRSERKRNELGYYLQDLINESRREAADNPPLTYPTKVRRAYKTHGGAPWLDDDYTIFGEVVEGMKTVNTIQKTPTNANEVPLREIRIIRMTIIE